ncbi:MAG: alpha/beta hydrolase [Deltaproteobacteria bacterium]|nr:alpha/beta hydrolase [Deltaproteobacteria bacterium]
MENTKKNPFLRTLLMPIKWSYVILVLILAGIAFYLFYPKVENFFVFFPQSSHDFTPEGFHLRYEGVYFRSKDGVKLHGWFFPLEKKSPVILFCHGNAGNISHRLDNIRLLLSYQLAVFIFDYRGFGKSAGRPSEKGIYEDGLAAYEHLVNRSQIPPEQIIPFGRSLGGAVAIEIALKRKVRSVILESAFTSTKDMAKSMIPFIIIAPFLPAHYNNLEKIVDVNAPKLLIHGDDDTLVPFSMGERLFAAAREPKFFYKIPGSGHNDTYIVGGPTYFRTFAGFARESIITEHSRGISDKNKMQNH